jgi:hypothetical protein
MLVTLLQTFRSSTMRTFLFLIFLVFMSAAQAQEWQWSVSLIGKRGPARAFLWIPTNCKNIRGVVVAQNNMEEISILENPVFRKAMADISFAEIWVSPLFDVAFNFQEGADKVFDKFMDSLAFVSGYAELKFAPVVGIGHSAAASFPYYFAARNPKRTLACISVSGQWPYVRNPQFSPDVWTKEQNIDFIPSLETMGEYEAAATWSAEGLKERKEHPFMPLSMLPVPGEGHFASSESKTEFIAFYIKKAAKYRLPKKWATGTVPGLKRIDPTKTGWLAEKWLLNTPPSIPAAPVGKYTGDTSQAFWYFDEETVRRVEAYGAKYRGLKPQLVGVIQEGEMVAQKNTHLQLDLKFLPADDGISFNIQPAFYDIVPGGSPRPGNWTNLEVGSPIGHAKGGGPIVVEKVAGPFKKISSNRFVLSLEKGLEWNPKSYTLTFAIKHPGDNQYKPAVQQAEMIIPAKITEGDEQTIIFPDIPNKKSGDKNEIILKARSTAGVPVYYYILEGPVFVEGSLLQFTKIPPKAKYPVKVTVIAWQYGMNGSRKLRTAEPVQQTFFIEEGKSFRLFKS